MHETRWEDFQFLELSLEGSNHTSRLPIPSGSQSIQIVQFTENGIWIEVPPRSCAVGHTLSLQIFARKRNGSRAEMLEDAMHVTGVVETIEGDFNSRQQVRLGFRQYAPEQWDRLIGYFTDKQTQINDLIRRTRR